MSRLGKKDPLQKLLDGFIKTVQPENAHLIRLEFDGEKVDLNMTPEDYDMDNDDLLDAVIPKKKK